MQENIKDSIFWIEVEKIKPNPFQPRKEFDEAKLNTLADSIRQYGVLQPLVVTKKEIESDGGMVAEYELIAGERRLRASKIANVKQVPVVIRTGEQTDKLKLELAIIENLQREDLNPIDRAKAFQELVDFGYTHGEIAKKVGKSREYVSNSVRLLGLPEEITEALRHGEITEGHARPLLMLGSRPEEQQTMFKDIILHRLSVRETEKLSRKIAVDKVRKQTPDLEYIEFENELSEKFGTRVRVEKKNKGGGKVIINFFDSGDLKEILEKISSQNTVSLPDDEGELTEEEKRLKIKDLPEAEDEKKEEDPELYSVSNFSL